MLFPELRAEPEPFFSPLKLPWVIISASVSLEESEAWVRVHHQRSEDSPEKQKAWEVSDTQVPTWKWGL